VIWPPSVVFSSLIATLFVILCGQLAQGFCSGQAQTPIRDAAVEPVAT
jgi:hypothetical protein